MSDHSLRALLEVGGARYQVEMRDPVALSIPLDFAGDQPEAFGLPAATARPWRQDDFVASVTEGGPLNCFGVELWPHGNGTHTETVGHLLSPPPPIGQALKTGWVPATLLEVEVCALGASADSYPSPGQDQDLVVTAGALERARARLGVDEPAWLQALVVRTLPNDAGKRRARYTGQGPTYLSVEAMRWVRAHGVRHLLVDLPSVDREEDAGQLVNHRCFWGIDAEVTDPDEVPDVGRTITEMIFAPDVLEPGRYVLDLQVPDFALDAAPSRPLLMRVHAG